MEFEDREPDQSLLTALETFRHAAFGPGAAANNWGAVVDGELIINLGRYRRYDYSSLRDLLRVVRNKKNHFREMPESLQRAMGPVPEGYYRYFNSRFPDLLMAVYVFAATHLADDLHLTKYWPNGTEAVQPFCKRFQLTSKSMSSSGGVLRSREVRGNASSGGVSNLNGGSGSASPRARRPEVSRLGGRPPVPPSPQQQQLYHQPQGAMGRALSPLAQRPPAGGSAALMATTAVAAAAAAPASAAAPVSSYAGAIGAGALELSGPAAPVASPASRFSSSNGGSGVPTSPVSQRVIVGYEVDGGAEQLHWPHFPRRPGEQPCEFYMKTGTCKYARDCCYDHPEEAAVPLTGMELPYREGEPVCAFYLKTNSCKFGAACKFHHPKLRPIYAGSAATPSKAE